jgi:hypothetical protein
MSRTCTHVNRFVSITANALTAISILGFQPVALASDRSASNRMPASSLEYSVGQYLFRLKYADLFTVTDTTDASAPIKEIFLGDGLNRKETTTDLVVWGMDEERDPINTTGQSLKIPADRVTDILGATPIGDDTLFFSYINGLGPKAKVIMAFMTVNSDGTTSFKRVISQSAYRHQFKAIDATQLLSVRSNYTYSFQDANRNNKTPDTYFDIYDKTGELVSSDAIRLMSNPDGRYSHYGNWKKSQDRWLNLIDGKKFLFLSEYEVTYFDAQKRHLKVLKLPPVNFDKWISFISFDESRGKKGEFLFTHVLETKAQPMDSKVIHERVSRIYSVSSSGKLTLISELPREKWRYIKDESNFLRISDYIRESVK